MEHSQRFLSLKVLVGLVAGAGASYGLYKLVFSKQDNEAKYGEKRAERESDGRETLTKIEKKTLLDKVSDFPVVRNKTAVDVQAAQVLEKSPCSLELQHLQMLIDLLRVTEDPTIQEKALVTLSNSAAFSVNQDHIRNMGGLPVIGCMLNVPVLEVKVKTLNALNNLSMNVKNQEQIKVYLPQILEIVHNTPLNSDLQVAGLRLLTNMSVTNSHQHRMISSVPQFLHLLVEGSETTQAPPSLLYLFDCCINKDILLRALTLVANLRSNMKNPDYSTVQYSKDSLHTLLFEESSPFKPQLVSLLLHPDGEVKSQVARITKQF
ncbi:armadillo repeat-containing protein 10 isoform X2 [Latimeria chalumnae]|uniref:armadillo repeat-containing protein 10 isoform X2 n=1 Tax=Latimeria chalumnae TaxID=7897 RepID=UPI00313BA32C